MSDTRLSATAPRGPRDFVTRRARLRDLGRARRRERMAQWLFLSPVIVYIIVFFCYPVAYNIRMSLTRYTTTSFYTGKAPFIGLANYLSVTREALFNTAFLNTAIFTVGSIVPQFILGLLLAVFFQRHFPLNRLLRALLLLPWLLPLVVAGTVYRWILDQDYGVINQALIQLHVISAPIPWLTAPHWGLASVILANIWAGIPFNLVVLYSGLEGIPRVLYEAAAVDGARAWKQFWHITLPMLRPVAAIALMLGLIYTIKVFDIIMILTNGGPADSTQTLATWAYFLSFIDLSFGKGAAIGNILIAITLVFAMLYLRSARSSFLNGR